MDQAITGFVEYLRQADAVGFSVFLLLLAMSAASWTVILIKLWRSARSQARTIKALQTFWAAPNLQHAVASLAKPGRRDPFAALAIAAERAQGHLRRTEPTALGKQVELSDFLTRELRNSIARSSAKLEWGQTVLASVGSTAPFVGLFGTVWGIYHALMSIGNSAQATLDKVAGPVGEALIMTGLGLAVAIPAVLAYNGFTRGNRLVLTELDGFAHDLHAWLTTGTPIERNDPSPHAHRSSPQPAAKGS